ncbi:MAG: hypothetical protein ACFE7R_00685 [Candidatus Hodarchaeota archaeon]
MSDDKIENIRKLIDDMQSGLVELFDQLRELRQMLDMVGNDVDLESLTAESLFAEVERPSSESIQPSTHEESSKSNEKMSEPSLVDSESTITPQPSSELPEARVARVLDPIAHELRTGEAPAEVVAEYLQAAKEYLIQSENGNEKVGRDMDVVLKFLRARGKNAIRDEERDNILKRIGRWKVHLSTYGSI